MRSGLLYVSRREVQLSPVEPQQTEQRTITVIPLPPSPAEMDDSAGVTGPANSSALADSAGVTGPTDSAEALDSAGYESARDLGSTVEDEPRLCTTQQLLLTQHSIRTQQVPTQHTHRFQSSAVPIFSLQSSGVSYCHHDPENSDTGAALSRWRRQGSPPPTLFQQSQEVWQVFCGFLNQTTLTGPRWGLAWQTLPRTGGVCWQGSILRRARMPEACRSCPRAHKLLWLHA